MAVVQTPVLKVILCGEYGVGKSSIFRRFINDSFVPTTDRRATLGLDHFEKPYHVADKDVKVIVDLHHCMQLYYLVPTYLNLFTNRNNLVFSLFPSFFN